MDQRTFENKVKELAEKLKQSKVAISDSQARQMAQDIIDTERRATKQQTQAIKQERKEAPVEQEQSTQEPASVPDAREQAQHQDPLVRRAIKQQQANEQRANTEDDIDQDVPISQLMEDAQKGAVKQAPSQQDKPQQPAKQERPSADASKQGASGPQKVTLDNPIVTNTSQKQESSAQPQRPAGGAPSKAREEQAPKPAKQEAPAAESSSQQEASGSKQESSKEDPEEKIDLSEMFNFSKRK